MNENRRGLGRGLAALIPNNPPVKDRPRVGPLDAYFPAPTPTAPAPAHDLQPTESVDPAVVDPIGTDAGTAGVGAESRPDADADAGADAGSDLLPVDGIDVAEIPVQQIRPNPRQPREVFDESELADLTASITSVGLLQPIVVRQVDAGAAPEADGPHYELVMGERRWRACKAAGLSAVPAIIRRTDDDVMLRDALLENLHRSQLNPLEEAAAYQQLLADFGCTHEVLAERLSRSRPQISNTLRLLALPALVQRRVAAGVLSAGHARALLGLSDPAAIERLAQRIVAEGLSVRSVEEIVALGEDDGQDPSTPTRRRRSAAPVPERATYLASHLTDALDTSVKVSMGKRKGKITIEFASVEDLDRISAVLAPQGVAEPGTD